MKVKDTWSGPDSEREEAPAQGAPLSKINDEALRLAALMLLFALMLSLCAATYAQAGASQTVVVDGVGAMEVTRISATVEAVDPANRMVTLKGPRGNVFSVHASEAVRNLAQVKAGDTVAMDYYESVAIEVKPTEAVPALTEVGAAGKAAAGSKPAGVALRKVRVVTNVLGVSTEGQTVLIRGPLGHLAEVKVKDAKLLGSLKTGGQVDITYVEGVALAVRAGKGA